MKPEDDLEIKMLKIIAAVPSEMKFGEHRIIRCPNCNGKVYVARGNAPGCFRIKCACDCNIDILS